MPETQEWFAAFYERNYKLVYRLCFTYMKNQAEAENCTEDVFVKVLTGGFTFHDEAHEKKWLTVTAVNLCKDRLKHLSCSRSSCSPCMKRTGKRWK